jgi:aryl-alcohol dehydrogenase-like predicted oxidoreductase
VTAETEISDRRDWQSRLGIGTVQFGQEYAIGAGETRPGHAEIASILEIAASAGIRLLDTASAYGDAEAVLGGVLPPAHQFRIVTKTAVFDHEAIRPEDSDTLAAVFRKSLDDLGVGSVYGLMVHKASNLLGEGGGHLFDAMENLKQQGRVQKIGVSVYDAQQIEGVLARFPVDLVQVPVSIFDQRLVAGGQLHDLKKKGIEIHARSVFLKGLVFANPQNLPDHFAGARERLVAFHEEVSARGATPQEVALSYILDNPDIDTVLCGVTNVAQLGQILSGMGPSPLPDPQRFALAGADILNPARWPAFSVAAS